MFCGECGRSVAVRPLVSAPLVEIVLDDAPPASREHLASINDLFAAPTPVEDEVPDEEPSAEAELSPEPLVEAEPSVEPAPAPSFEPELSVEPEPELAPEPEPIASAPTAVVAQQTDDLVDLEQTRLTGPNQSGERFVLQFSTGESVTVFGTGIIGRNPTPEPSEYFDQRVTIFDPTKSVSKTHLEFGQTAGAFWINDRYSGNGTGVRQPEAQRVSCEPGKRYLVARGSRVDIGEQFFIVS